ncbi:recombination-associated protein RdgC [Zwartia vadi]|uniref:recombination-associated protein RdgC n=1 Tax=Zwartia vadi TaxID=3058168 RepID=UPI0025B4EB23|nr:recombination-associated protein RdgC [Zwartia vadi]MDN3988009.1 recombination-associated protein RdgC [Zwartia vadi]
MWFKNLKLFRLSNTWNWTAEQLDALLAKEQFTSPGAATPTASGWTQPREDDVRLAYSVDRQILCAFRSEKKLLPASVINQFVKQRAIELEEQQGFKPGRKQLRDLKEEVTNALIPRAFSLTRDTRVWIDPVNHWLVIDTASASKAEEILSALGKAIYPFPVEPIQVTLSPAAAMTQWITSGQAPANFSIDQDAELRAGGDKAAAIRYVKHTLDITDIEKHIQAGKQCTRLALTWHDKVSFVLTESLDIKRIAPQDILDGNEQLAPANDAEKFDGEFTLMCAELNHLLSGLLEALEEKTFASQTS